MATNYHMCIDIKWLLENKIGKRSLKGFFTKDDGSACTNKEARDYLYDCLKKGYEVLPMGECDNFCYQKGCQGHPVNNNQ